MFLLLRVSKIGPIRNSQETNSMTDPNQNGATVDINQEALTLAYNDAFDGGFVGTQAEFFQLLCEDEQAQGWSFESAQLGGFEGSFDDFKGLLSLPDIIEKVDNETPKEDDEVKKKDTFGPLSEEDTRSLSLESEFSSADPNFSVEKSVKFQEEYKKDKYKKAVEYFKDARPDLDFPTKEEYYGVGKAPMLTETSEYKDVTDISADEKRVREEQAKIAQEYREGKRELTPQQSLVNTLHNSLGQLATVDDTFRYMYGVVTNDMKQIGLAEAEMERVDSMAQPTMEFTDGASLTEDPAKFAAAVIDGFSGFATSAIIYNLTGGPYTMGIGLASDMIARSIRDHNKTKAEANKTSVEELHKTGEFEVLIPGSIGVLAYKLEKAGIRGVGTAINRLATKGYSKLAKLLTFGGSQFQEGATEFGQNILEDINNFLASLNVEESKKIYRGRPDLLAEVIGKEFVKSATSRESREAFYKGIAGGAGGTTLGSAYKKVMSVTKSKEETDKQDDLTERILDLEAMERNPSLNESEKEGIKTSKDAALEELKRIQIEAEKMAENYSQEQIDEFVQLREEQVFLNNQLWTTENSKNLNREQKNKVIQNLQDKFQKNVSRVKEIQKEAIEGAKTKKEESPSQPTQEEVLVEEETDPKGRTFKRYATTTEKDGIKTTTYTFNRSDKEASQRSKSIVKPEVAFGERFEVDPESEYNDVIFEDELKVVGVENILENPNPRSDQTQYQSDVVVENKEGGRTTLKGIRLREKTPQPITETESGLILTEEDGSTFVDPEGSSRYAIGETQRTVAVIDSSGKLLGAFDAKTGKKRKTTESSEAELIDQFDYDKGESAFEGLEGVVKDPNELIASRSKNPKEVAKAYIEEKSKKPEEKSEEGDSQLLLDLRENNQRFSLKSLLAEKGNIKELFPGKKINELSDKELRKAKIDLNKNYPGILKWVAKEDKNTNIEDVSRDNYGVEPDDVFEAIKGKSPVPNKVSVTEANLKELFKELTGLKGTDSQIKKVAEQDSEQLMEPREPAEVQEEREGMELQREIMEKEGVETEQGAKNLIESLKKWAKLGLNKFSNLRSKIGLDPKRGNVLITRLQEAYKGGMKSETYAALSRFQNIETLIKKLSKSDQDKARVVSDKILRGEKVTQEEFSSFEDISKLSSDFRLAIDKLSQELIDLGILPPDSEQNISDNIGEYLNRAYLAFTDPNYKPDDIVRQKAKRFLQKNPKAIIKQAKQRAKEEGISLNKAIAKQADIYLDSLLEKDDSGSPMSREFKLNKSILKQKKGVPKPLREFLGEIKDGRQAAYISHLKLASLVNTARYQKGILNSGLGKFIYEKNDPNRPPDSVEIKGSAYDILSGYYASPDVVDAIIPKQNSSVEGALKVLTDLNGLVKGWKTVYNPTSYLRNYISTMVMLATRGDLSMKHFIDAHKAYLNTLKGKKVFEEKMFEYKKMGIVGQNIDVGVIKSAMRDNDTDMETGLYKRMTKKDDSQESILRRSIKSIYKLGKLGKGIQFTAERMQTIFQAGDDIGRMMAYEKRKEAHADMMFDKTVEQLDDSELKQVQEAAAEEIKDQYNNYDRVPPLIKKLSRNILVGSFVQFPAEMIRNTANTIGSTITRMKDKNPKVRKDAKTRLATFLGAQSALVIGTTFLGDSIMDMFNMDDEEEDEVQRVKDLRNVVAPWSKNHKIIVRKIGDNKLSYIDVSANNPYNMISRLIQKVGIDGIGNNNDTYEVMFDFFGPFLDQEILISSIQESVNGQTESGKPLFFDTDGPGEKLTKGTAHILKEIMPGYMRFVQRVTDEDKSTVNELISLTGFRTTEVDLDTSLYFKMRAAYSDMQDLQASYRMNLSKGKDTYDDSAIKYGEAITKANEILQSHIRLGLDPKLAYQQMKKMMGKNQKFSNNEIKAIIYGVEIAFKEAKK